MENIGELVRLYRAKNQVTQEELAQKCGLTKPTISRVEKTGTCSTLTLGKLLKVIE